jgi:hypothetical protein
MSVNNRLYTANIKVYGYTGSVITLTADTDPLTLEENDDTDLLNVIRYTTGYINILADDSIDVADIFPTTSITERYVEILEGSTVIFRGYVQAQEFSRMGNYATTGNPPQSVSIPIISPLGLIDDLEFDKVTSPTDFTLWELLKICLYKLGGNPGGVAATPYTYVYFPQVVSGSALLKKLKLPSLVISPYSDDNTHDSSTTVADCFEVVKIGYFLEGLCRCFGCMVHDTPDALVFTKFDYSGSYVRYDLLDSTTNVSQPGNLTLAPSIVFDGGIEIAQIAPLRKLTCQYDGDRDTSLDMNFQHCRRVRGNDNAYQRNLVVNRPLLTSEISAPYLQNNCSINSQNGVPTVRGTYLIAYGEGDNMREMAVINFETDDTSGHNWATDDILLKTMFQGYFGTDMTLTVKFEWGENMNLECPIAVPYINRYIYMTIKNGSKYLNDSNQWVSTQFKRMIGVRELETSKGVLTMSIPSTGMETIPIEVTFYEYDMREFEAMTCLAITELTLKGEAADPATEYMNDGSNPKEYVLKGNGIDEQDISVAFACYGQKNSHMLFPSVGFSRPQYPYIFRKRQQVKVAYQDYMGGKINPDLYMRNVVWKGTTMRVISANYSADYEQTTLTLQET